jgi:Tfp pilus assembly protein PilF
VTWVWMATFACLCVGGCSEPDWVTPEPTIVFDEELNREVHWAEAAYHFTAALALSIDQGNNMSAARAANNLGAIALDHGRLEEAGVYFDASLQAVPGNSDALANRAVVKIQMARQKPEQREVLLLEAVECYL